MKRLEVIDNAIEVNERRQEVKKKEIEALRKKVRAPPAPRSHVIVHVAHFLGPPPPPLRSLLQALACNSGPRPDKQGAIHNLKLMKMAQASLEKLEIDNLRLRQQRIETEDATRMVGEVARQKAHALEMQKVLAPVKDEDIEEMQEMTADNTAKMENLNAALYAPGMPGGHPCTHLWAPNSKFKHFARRLDSSTFCLFACAPSPPLWTADPYADDDEELLADLQALEDEAAEERELEELNATSTQQAMELVSHNLPQSPQYSLRDGDAVRGQACSGAWAAKT